MKGRCSLIMSVHNMRLACQEAYTCLSLKYQFYENRLLIFFCLLSIKKMLEFNPSEQILRLPCVIGIDAAIMRLTLQCDCILLSFQ